MPCFIPPRMLQSGASFYSILSVASDAPVRGTGFSPGRCSPGAWAVLHSARSGCSNPGRLFVVFSPLPRTLLSVAPGSLPDDPVRGLGPNSTPPRLLQSGASCFLLSLLSSTHQPHSPRSCELALRAVGAARGCPGGAPLAWVWGVRGRALSHPRPLVLSGVRPGSASRWPWVRCAGVGARLSIAPCPCRGSSCVVRASRVRGTRWLFWIGTCPCAPVVAGGVPLWRASWPRVGAPLLVRSGRSQCSGRLSRRRGAFPHPWGCRPRLYWVAARGTWRPAENRAHCACRWPLQRQGRWARSASYPFRAPRWGRPWRVLPASV